MRPFNFAISPKGMFQDAQELYTANEQAFEIKNMRFSSIDRDSTEMALVNERGTLLTDLYKSPSSRGVAPRIVYMNFYDSQKFVSENSSELIEIEGVVVGKYDVGNTTIVFTHSETSALPDNIYILYTKFDKLFCYHYFSGFLNFDTQHLIDAVSLIEDENTYKVYWVDGKNPTRMLNYATIVNSAGTLETPTDVFDFRKKIYGDVNEIPCSVDVVKTYDGGPWYAAAVKYYVTAFNYQMQESSIIGESFMYYTSFQDRGCKDEEVCYNSFRLTIHPSQYIKSNFSKIRVYRIMRRNNTAAWLGYVVGDYEISDECVVLDTNTSVEACDINDILFKNGQDIIASTIAIKNNALFLGNIQNLSVDINAVDAESKKIQLSFGYDDGVDLSKKDNKLLENYYFYDGGNNELNSWFRGETYHFGIQFQDNRGCVTNIYYVGKVKCNKPSYYSTSYNKLMRPTLKVNFSNCNMLVFSGYKAYKLYFLKDDNVNNICCQGMLVPFIVKTDTARTTVNLNNWFTRIYCEPNDDTNDISSSTNIMTIPSYNSSQGEVNFYNSTSKMLDLSKDIYSFNYPDITFLNATRPYTKIRRVGYLDNKVSYTHVSVTTSTAKTLIDSTEPNGLLIDTMQRNNGRIMLGSLIWHDGLKGMNVNAEESCVFMLYPWHGSGSLNCSTENVGDSDSDDSNKSISLDRVPSKLKRKIWAVNRFFAPIEFDDLEYVLLHNGEIFELPHFDYATDEVFDIKFKNFINSSSSVLQHLDDNELKYDTVYRDVDYVLNYTNGFNTEQTVIVNDETKAWGEKVYGYDWADIDFMKLNKALIDPSNRVGILNSIRNEKHSLSVIISNGLYRTYNDRQSLFNDTEHFIDDESPLFSEDNISRKDWDTLFRRSAAYKTNIPMFLNFVLKQIVYDTATSTEQKAMWFVCSINGITQTYSQDNYTGDCQTTIRFVAYNQSVHNVYVNVDGERKLIKSVYDGAQDEMYNQVQPEDCSFEFDYNYSALGSDGMYVCAYSNLNYAEANYGTASAGAWMQPREDHQSVCIFLSQPTISFNMSKRTSAYIYMIFNGAQYINYTFDSYTDTGDAHCEGYTIGIADITPGGVELHYSTRETKRQISVLSYTTIVDMPYSYNANTENGAWMNLIGSNSNENNDNEQSYYYCLRNMAISGTNDYNSAKRFVFLSSTESGDFVHGSFALEEPKSANKSHITFHEHTDSSLSNPFCGIEYNDLWEETQIWHTASHFTEVNSNFIIACDAFATELIMKVHTGEYNRGNHYSLGEDCIFIKSAEFNREENADKHGILGIDKVNKTNNCFSLLTHPLKELSDNSKIVAARYRSIDFDAIYCENLMYQDLIGSSNVKENALTIFNAEKDGVDVTSDSAYKYMFFPCSKFNVIPTNNEDNVIETFGDTFYQMFYNLRTMAYSDEDEETVIDQANFFCETRINLLGRCDMNIYKADNRLANNLNTNVYNLSYNQIDDFGCRYAYNANDADDNKLFRASIYYSKKKFNNEKIDTFCSINSTFQHVANQACGPITKLLGWADRLLIFQEKGVGLVGYDERAALSVSNGEPVVLGNTGEITGIQYLSTENGCINKFAITSAASGVYYLDNETKCLNSIIENLKDVSTTVGFKTFFKNDMFNNLVYDGNKFKDGSALMQYDKINKEIHIVSNVEDYTDLVYSELYGVFTSFYSYDNCWFVDNFNKHYLLRPDGDKTLVYERNKGKYNFFFDKYEPHYMTLLANGGSSYVKVFTNIQFVAEKYKNNDAIDDIQYRPYTLREDMLNETFDRIDVWDEYQQASHKLDFKKAKPSNLKVKFREWNIQIPRAKRNQSTLRGLDRFIDQWVFIKLTSNVDSDNTDTEENDLKFNKKHILHSLNVGYWANVQNK